uniref:Zinc/manganese transporter permease n=1 Tax=uncultured bacterium 50 TaxID=1748278 RepID=A0A0U3BC49_9BACT|nr:zinc/manganese transporter permease [uncultured bacterium 50]
MNAADWGFDFSLLGAPLVAGLLVVATHVLLGRSVLERGIIFIDLTIAQVAALGVIAVGLAEMDHVEGWLTQAAAGIAALAAAALLTWTEGRFRKLQEALIGSLYVVSASAALLMLARNPHGAEHMQELLAGQILWIGSSQLWPVAALYAVVLGLWFAFARTRPQAFYFLFALTVMASVQLVGVYLVFASLILPAIATSGLDERRGLAVGYTIGAGGYALGLWLSVPLDMPAGPLIVCVLAGLMIVTAIVRGGWVNPAARSTH